MLIQLIQSKNEKPANNIDPAFLLWGTIGHRGVVVTGQFIFSYNRAL